ncbi:MAG TPA: hypothetical protein VGC18_02380 [Lacisediminihabitans sp.]|uniref:hypothetical protein n=1 Tax=Lacisediminihabitans sp. TaxID=2787631 RepID=UPI002EDA7CC2
MAEVTVQGDEVVLALTPTEKLEAIRGDVRVPRTAVRDVEVVEDALDVVHGIRTGTGIPGVLVVGTIRGGGKKSFVVVHHGRPRGVVIRLNGAEYDELVVGCDDPEAVAASLAPRT